jgi:pyruvate kinase
LLCSQAQNRATGGGEQKIIAKIERREAVEAFDDILEAADAIMIARGDLGLAMPPEQIPFIQTNLTARANAAGKPVIVATEMMLSMMHSITPTRADITDVAYAAITGADAVMLSNETATGNHPIEAVVMMERVLKAAEREGYGTHVRFL